MTDAGNTAMTVHRWTDEGGVACGRFDEGDRDNDGTDASGLEANCAACNAVLAAALTEERFGSVPERRPGEAAARLRFIATLHALIQWVTEHPNLPAPWACTLSFHVGDTAALERLAFDLGHDASHGQISIFNPLGSAPEFYTPITISVSKPDRPL